MADARDRVLDRDLVVVSGPDAFPFLQSLVSQDLDGIAEGEVRPSLLLSPQGKLDAAFRVVRVGDEAWLDVEGGFGARLAASLGRFRIRVDAEVEDRSPGRGMVAVRGSAPEPPRGVLALVVEARSTDGGVDLLGSVADLAAVAAAGLTADEYERARIEAGAGRLGVDLDESVVPQEAHLDAAAVSFTKGCFLGQELVCRIDTRGHVNKYLRRLTDFAGAPPPPGAEIVAGEKVVGTVTSSAPTAALGYVRREVEPPAPVELRWDGGAGRAVVEAIPASA
jgi:folate-binding protein YgfZ